MTDPVSTPLVIDASGKTEGVYEVLQNDDDGTFHPWTGLSGFMAAAPNDPNRPDGHMTLIRHYRHSLTFDFNINNVGQIRYFQPANPAKMDWWRSMTLPQETKRNTHFVGASDIVINGESNLVVEQFSP